MFAGKLRHLLIGLAELVKTQTQFASASGGARRMKKLYTLRSDTEANARRTMAK
jgi:hypothetical protein